MTTGEITVIYQYHDIISSTMSVVLCWSLQRSIRGVIWLLESVREKNHQKCIKFMGTRVGRKAWQIRCLYTGV